jgi:hypothetical protein
VVVAGVWAGVVAVAEWVVEEEEEVVAAEEKEKEKEEEEECVCVCVCVSECIITHTQHLTVLRQKL